MKDKRQRMAMAWPYGIADPNIYAYIMNAAASLSSYAATGNSPSYPGLAGSGLPGNAPPAAAGAPAPPPPPPGAAGLNYYASLGLQRAAAAYNPYSLQSPLRPRAELLPGLVPPPGLPTNPLLRSAEPLTSSPITGGLLPPPRDGATGGLPAPLPSHLLPTSGDYLLPPYPSNVLPTPALGGTDMTSSSLRPSTTSPPSSKPSLFQPYKTDADRAEEKLANSA